MQCRRPSCSTLLGVQQLVATTLRFQPLPGPCRCSTAVAKAGSLAVGWLAGPAAGSPARRWVLHLVHRARERPLSSSRSWCESQGLGWGCLLWDTASASCPL